MAKQNRTQILPQVSFLASFLLLALMAGCQKKDTVSDKSVDSSGNCTASYIQDYNNVVNATVDLENLYSQATVSEGDFSDKIANLKTACAVMAADHKSMNCNAKVANDANQTLVAVHYEDLRPNCSGIFKQMTDNKSAGKPMSTKPFSGKETKTKLTLSDDQNY